MCGSYAATPQKKGRTRRHGQSDREEVPRTKMDMKAGGKITMARKG